MQILINIPEEYLDSEVIHITAVTGVNNKITDVNVEGAYAEFQVLPKGYGDLISRSRLRKNMEFVCMGIMAGTEPYNAPLTEIDNAPTIIEADKEADNETN